MRTSSLCARPVAVALIVALALALGACSSGGKRAKVKTGSVSIATVSLMTRLDMPRQSPILIRVFKEEAVLEVWKQDSGGRYRLLRNYEICRFSGKLGPKKYEGDKQAPEGFYEINAEHLNPWSRNHLAFNIGFPNAFDRSLGRTGSNVMVHGGCKSVGCYAMTHNRIEEIYALVREAIASGQETVPFQAFPFRMTDDNMARHADNPNMAFWERLKIGHDAFATMGRPIRVAGCAGAYRFVADPRFQDVSDADICAAAARTAAAEY